jgi:hypothetical protein
MDEWKYNKWTNGQIERHTKVDRQTGARMDERLSIQINE